MSPSSAVRAAQAPRCRSLPAGRDRLVTAASPDTGAFPLDVHFDRPKRPVESLISGQVREQVVTADIRVDPLHPDVQVVGVSNRKSAGRAGNITERSVSQIGPDLPGAVEKRLPTGRILASRAGRGRYTRQLTGRKVIAGDVRRQQTLGVDSVDGQVGSIGYGDRLVEVVVHSPAHDESLETGSGFSGPRHSPRLGQ